MKFPDVFVGKRLFVGLGRPEILGRGPKEVRGSAYVEGPQITGNPELFSPVVAAKGEAGPTFELGATMASQNTNKEMIPPPFYALFVRMYARIASFLKVDTLLCVDRIKTRIIYSEVIMAKNKNFVIPHPSQEGKNLVYSCLEGPENGVYVRGTLRNNNTIELPYYWKDLVHNDSITVSLTPVGCHQDLIVTRVSNEVVVVQTQSPYPIQCFYHVYGERKDIRKLEVEVDA